MPLDSTILPSRQFCASGLTSLSRDGYMDTAWYVSTTTCVCRSDVTRPLFRGDLPPPSAYASHAHAAEPTEACLPLKASSAFEPSTSVQSRTDLSSKPHVSSPRATCSGLPARPTALERAAFRLSRPSFATATCRALSGPPGSSNSPKTFMPYQLHCTTFPVTASCLIILG